MTYSILIAGVATVLLTAAAAPVRASSTQALTPDRSMHVTIDGVSIDESAVRTLFSGIYDAAGAMTGQDVVAKLSGQLYVRRPKIVDTVTMPRANMPQSYPYFYYKGRDPGSSHEIVWQSNVDRGDVDSSKASDEFLAAYALAALDAGYVGKPWASLYNSAQNNDARQALGQRIVSVIAQASDQQKAIGQEDARWIRQHIATGISRMAAYDLLRAYGLVAYNAAYNPGIPTKDGGLGGCDYAPDQRAAAWPYHGEPLPKRTGVCATFTHDPGAYPSAYIDLPGAFSIACGSQVHVTIEFDNSDKVASVKIPDPDTTCM